MSRLVHFHYALSRDPHNYLSQTVITTFVKHLPHTHGEITAEPKNPEVQLNQIQHNLQLHLHICVIIICNIMRNKNTINIFRVLQAAEKSAETEFPSVLALGKTTDSQQRQQQH